MTATNPTPTEQLMDRITAMADEYDITGLQDVVRGQIAINTALETEYSHLRLELAALREFVAAADALADFEAEHPAGLWPITVIADLDARQQAFVQARQRLATEFGIELPGAEAEESDPVCPTCGETFSADCWRCVGAEDPRS